MKLLIIGALGSVIGLVYSLVATPILTPVIETIFNPSALWDGSDYWAALSLWIVGCVFAGLAIGLLIGGLMLLAMKSIRNVRPLWLYVASTVLIIATFIFFTAWPSLDQSLFSAGFCDTMTYIPGSVCF